MGARALYSDVETERSNATSQKTTFPLHIPTQRIPPAQTTAPATSPTRTVRQTTTTSPCYGLYEVGVASLFFEV